MDGYGIVMAGPATSYVLANKIESENRFLIKQALILSKVLCCFYSIQFSLVNQLVLRQTCVVHVTVGGYPSNTKGNKEVIDTNTSELRKKPASGSTLCAA
ncbi:unnamed protein product [Rhodiola kirilowii]